MSEGYSLTALNKPTDWNNLTTMDKKHVPIIEVPASVKSGQPFEVQLKVGGIEGVEHPNQLSHYITWIELYAGERYIGKIEFAPVVSNGYKAKLHVTLEKPAALRARAFCNLHGLWEGQEKKVTVQ
jgi:superoxide reductase